MSDQTHSYYEWQVSTLMLAYDVVKPLGRDDDQGLAMRQQSVEEELRELVISVLPQEYVNNPELEFPPDMVARLTPATINRAAAIIAGN